MCCLHLALVRAYGVNAKRSEREKTTHTAQYGHADSYTVGTNNKITLGYIEERKPFSEKIKPNEKMLSRVNRHIVDNWKRGRDFCFHSTRTKQNNVNKKRM